MTTEQFNDWKRSHRLSKAATARLLGCSEKTVAAYEYGQSIPKYIALAIAAVQFHLPPYGG